MKRFAVLTFGMAILFSSVGCCYNSNYCATTGVPCGGQWATSCYVPVPNPLRVVEGIVKLPCYIFSGCHGWGHYGYGNACCDSGYGYGHGYGCVDNSCCAPGHGHHHYGDGCCEPGGGVMAPHAMAPYPQGTPYVEGPMQYETYGNGAGAPMEGTVPMPAEPTPEGDPMSSLAPQTYYTTASTGSQMFVAPNQLPPMIPARTLQDARAQQLASPSRL